MNDKTIPKLGQHAVVRNRPAIIREVRNGVTGSSISSFMVSIDYVDGVDLPDSEVILWDLKSQRGALSTSRLTDVSNTRLQPDEPLRFRSLLDSLRWHSAIQIEDYQLYPLHRSIEMPMVRPLLADDVGLGKTIEAGLILFELFARRRMKRVLIVCPASLQTQWRDKLKDKFSLDFIAALMLP